MKLAGMEAAGIETSDDSNGPRIPAVRTAALVAPGEWIAKRDGFHGRNLKQPCGPERSGKENHARSILNLNRFFLSQTFEKPHASQCAYRQPFCPSYLLKFVHLPHFNAALYNGIFSKPFTGLSADLFHTLAKSLLPLFRCFFTGHH